MACGLLALAVCLPRLGAAAQTADGQTTDVMTYAVVVTGLGGEEAYEKLIQGWGKDLYTALRRDGVAEQRLFWLAAQKQEGVSAESRQEEIVKLLGQLAGRIRPQDLFLLFLIGHGSYDDYDYRFSIPGPDLTAAQWSELLNRIRAERQVVANMTSSSGASLAALQRKGRVVITSTSAGRERNFSVFARYFVEALQGTVADANKNEEVSALEAFQFATGEVARYYESFKRLATEHALMEDRGDGEGVRQPSPQTGQGLLASAIPLVRLGPRQAAAATPQIRDLRAKKRTLEEAIEELKYRKPAMDTSDYMRQLEKLLLELSRTQQSLDKLEGQ